MLLGPSPAAPMLGLPPIMPQLERSGRCFLQAWPVNECRLWPHEAWAGRQACLPQHCAYAPSLILGPRTGPLYALQRPPRLPA